MVNAQPLVLVHHTGGAVFGCTYTLYAIWAQFLQENNSTNLTLIVISPVIVTDSETDGPWE